MIKHDGKSVPDLDRHTWVRVEFADGEILTMELQDGLPVAGVEYMQGNWWTWTNCDPTNNIVAYEVVDD